MGILLSTDPLISMRDFKVCLNMKVKMQFIMEMLSKIRVTLIKMKLNQLRLINLMIKNILSIKMQVKTNTNNQTNNQTMVNLLKTMVLMESNKTIFIEIMIKVDVKILRHESENSKAQLTMSREPSY